MAEAIAESVLLGCAICALGCIATYLTLWAFDERIDD